MIISQTLISLLQHPAEGLLVSGLQDICARAGPFATVSIAMGFAEMK
jgi:hypothetical protein